ncbi:hypothetical protein [Alkalicoccus daliensis]|uniref:DUF5610 domain-containing protein n=1 Tax=Alkalicoccus daliensis TaxID=745820 RepID=A0A1H0L282_9BACI|nr:hypothetical protein [Alkalicoccus daliensis]SDO62090.1 hypothetical protein SAMN04488053_1235 [Alkalicoccus daliensis]
MEISRYQPSQAKPAQPAAPKNQEATEKTVKDSKETYTPSPRPDVKNMSPEERDNYLNKLRQESDKHFESLKNLVAKMLEKQGFTFQDLHGDSNVAETIEVDEETRLAAEKAVAEDGPYGAEAVSDRLVNFAIALSGGNVDKLDVLRGAIDMGFKAVEDIFGELPEVSKQTYALIQEKLAAWEKEQRGTPAESRS